MSFFQFLDFYVFIGLVAARESARIASFVAVFEILSTFPFSRLVYDVLQFLPPGLLPFVIYGDKLDQILESGESVVIELLSVMPQHP